MTANSTAEVTFKLLAMLRNNKVNQENRLQQQNHKQNTKEGTLPKYQNVNWYQQMLFGLSVWLMMMIIIHNKVMMKQQHHVVVFLIQVMWLFVFVLQFFQCLVFATRIYTCFVCLFFLDSYIRQICQTDFKLCTFGILFVWYDNYVFIVIMIKELQR